MGARSGVRLSWIVVAMLGTAGAAVAQDAAIPATRAIVTVDASHPWVGSGLTVRKGERLAFETQGTIRWGLRPDQVVGPDGHDGKPGTVGAGGLIGRVGTTGKPFAIGHATAPLIMPKAGVLYLGINDFVFGDNRGAFTVTIVQAETP